MLRRILLRLVYNTKFEKRLLNYSCNAYERKKNRGNAFSKTRKSERISWRRIYPSSWFRGEHMTSSGEQLADTRYLMISTVRKAL